MSLERLRAPCFFVINIVFTQKCTFTFTFEIEGLTFYKNHNITIVYQINALRIKTRNVGCQKNLQSDMS